MTPKYIDVAKSHGRVMVLGGNVPDSFINLSQLEAKTQSNPAGAKQFDVSSEDQHLKGFIRKGEPAVDPTFSGAKIDIGARHNESSVEESAQVTETKAKVSI